jgi:hypothetical protein
MGGIFRGAPGCRGAQFGNHCLIELTLDLKKSQTPGFVELLVFKVGLGKE